MEARELALFGAHKARVRMITFVTMRWDASTSYLEPHVASDLRNLGTATSVSATQNLSPRESEALCAFFFFFFTGAGDDVSTAPTRESKPTAWLG